MKKQKLARMKDVMNHITVMAARKTVNRGINLRIGWEALGKILWEVENASGFKPHCRAPRREEAVYQVPGIQKETAPAAAWEQMFNTNPKLFGFVFYAVDHTLNFKQRVGLCIQMVRRVVHLLDKEGVKALHVAEEYVAGTATRKELETRAFKIKKIVEIIDCDDDGKDLMYRATVYATTAVANAIEGCVEKTSDNSACAVACETAHLKNCYFGVPFGVDHFGESENASDSRRHAERAYQLELLRAISNPFAR